MRDIFYGGEFAHWLEKQENVPYAALKEWNEASNFFSEETGFNVNEAWEKFYEDENEK